MKRSFMGTLAHRLRWAAPVMASGLLLASCGGSAEGGDSEEFKLVFNSFIPEASHLSQAAASWLDEVEEESDGRITFQRHWGGALADVLEANDAMGQGRIDVGVNSLAYEPDQFYLTEGLLKVPFQTNDMVALSAAITQMNETYEETSEEFSSKNLRMLAAIPTTPVLLGTTDKPIESHEDLDGLSIRGAGETSPIDAALKAAGAEPVGMPVTDMYTSLQRGVIDGQMTFGLLDGPSWSMEEVMKHWIDPGFGPFAAPFLLMNEETYDGLPEDLQKVVDEATSNLVGNYVENILPEASEEACKTVQEAGVELTAMDESAQEEWAGLWLDDFTADWKDLVNERGVDADEYLEAFKSAVEENASGMEDQGAFLGCES